VVAWIDAAIKAKDNESALSSLKAEVRVFARQFPLFAW
jgi:glycine hydroxymethyltransferase